MKCTRRGEIRTWRPCRINPSLFAYAYVNGWTSQWIDRDPASTSNQTSLNVYRFQAAARVIVVESSAIYLILIIIIFSGTFILPLASTKRPNFRISEIMRWKIRIYRVPSLDSAPSLILRS